MKQKLTRASNAGKLTLLIGLLLLAPLLALPFFPEDARFAASFLIPGGASILLGALPFVLGDRLSLVQGLFEAGSAAGRPRACPLWTCA